MRKHIFILMLALSNPVYADIFTCGGCASEVTQLLNNAELLSIDESELETMANTAGSWAEEIEQTAQQITMVQNQITDLMQHPLSLLGPSWRNVFQSVQKMMTVVQRGQSLAYQMQNISGNFDQLFPSFDPENPYDYMKLYKTRSAAVKDSAKATLEAANTQYEDLSDDQEAIDDLQEMSNTSTGTVQVQQAGNGLTGAVADQVVKLRILNMESMSMQANQIAAQQSKEDAEVKAMRDFVSQGREGVYIRPIGSSGNHVFTP